MKKSVVIALLGLAVGAVSSFGQGTIVFNSYIANGSVGIPTLFSGVLGSGPVGAGYSADLLYSLTPIADVAGNGLLTPGWIFSGAGAPSVQSVVTTFGTSGPTLGYFQNLSANFGLIPYTAGTPVYFEVIAYQTASNSYAGSLNRGHSAQFSATLATGLTLPDTANFAPFTVSLVPEPTTLALAGLGGLGLLLFRRKQS
jgi:PEP-CTERM motif